MNTVTAHRELGRYLSTMEKLEQERNRLARAAYHSRIVALAVWIVVAWIGAYQVGVWINGRAW